jgi:hypothetical protein
MASTGKPHLGRTPTLTHVPIGFIPCRWIVSRLFPMHNGCLVTPIEKVRHRPAMRSAGHVLPHVVLTIPDRHRPESPTPIDEKRTGFESGRPLDLLDGTGRVHRKRRQKSDGPYPQASDAHKRHPSFIDHDLRARAEADFKPPHYPVRPSPAVGGDQVRVRVLSLRFACGNPRRLPLHPFQAIGRPHVSSGENK